MSSKEEGVNCKAHLRKLALVYLNDKEYRYARRKSEKKDIRLLESKAWNALLMSLCSPYVTSVANHISTNNEDIYEDNKFKIFNDLMTETYYLKAAGKSKQAKNIEVLAEKLKMKDGIIESEVVRFLLSLAWSVEDSQDSLIFPDYDYKVPTMDESSNLGMKRNSFCNDAGYISGRFFNQEFIFKKREKMANIFEEIPGTHFEGKQSNFAWKKPKEETAVAGTTLFGALTQSNTSSVDMTLEIPDVDSKSSSLLSAIQKPSKQTSEDEGFVDESSITTSNEEENIENEEINLSRHLNIWTDAQKMDTVNSYTWEKLQSYDTRQDNPFLTESGDVAFDHLCNVRTFEVALLTSSQSANVQLSRDEILRQSLDVLLGLSSKMYIFNKSRCCFDVSDDATTTGLSTGALRGLTKAFANIGSLYKQINKFIDHHSDNHSGLSAGLTLQAFVNSLQVYMNAYKTTIMKIREQSHCSIMILWVVLRQLRQQLKFLADICLCSVAFGRNKNAPKPKFPTGLKLLSYIHKLCQQNRCTMNYHLLLHIYKSTAAPFLRSVGDWIYAGLCTDLNAEFFVEINDHYLCYRDKHYWTHGFKEKQNKSDLSMFENDLLEQIFACGKTINLLKKTFPEHYLLRNNLKLLPDVDIKFSLKELDNIKEQCEKYTNNVKMAYEAEKKQKEIEVMKENKMKRDALVAEQNKTKDALEKIHELENKVKLAIKEKKENELKFLKDQMLTAIEERKIAKKTEMEKDVEFIKMAETMELEQKERFEKERQEIISYYEEMSLLAAKRESRALWLVRRFELRKKRNEFLHNDQKLMLAKVPDLTLVEKEQEKKDENEIMNNYDKSMKNNDEMKVESNVTSEEKTEMKSILDEMIKDFQIRIPSVEGKEAEIGERVDENAKINTLGIKDNAETKEITNKNQLINMNRNEDKIEIAQNAEGNETKKLIYYDDEIQTNNATESSARDKRFWKIEKTESQKKDSTLQNVLYPEKYEQQEFKQITSTRGKEPESKMKQLLYHQNSANESKIEDIIVSNHLTNEEIWMDSETEPFEIQFDKMDELPNPDLYSAMNKLKKIDENDNEINAIYHLPIEVILQRSLHTSLKSQILVVQDAIVRYFFDHLKIGVHFAAFRKYLLLEDGEFGRSLCYQIFDKALMGVSPKEFCIPTVMNNMISRAMQLSLFADKIEFSRQFTFSLKSIPEVLKSTDIAALDFLELRYKVPWPCNIVITENCVSKYNKVFSFLLRLKKVNWALQGVWANLKKAGQNRRISSQLRTLQLFRYEMRHFVNNVERYIVNQVIHISWQEFQHDLSNKVHGIDDLHTIHGNYLNKIIFRSLLTKNAGPVFKIISDIFSLILKMHVQLISSTWQQDDQSIIHPSFKSMCLTYNAFQEYTGFLFKIVSKLVQRGYQRHLDDFLLQVNFNGYYDERTNS